MRATTICAILAATLAASPAAAIDFTQVLLNEEGCPFKNSFTTARGTYTVGKPECAEQYAPEDKNRPDLTLGEAIRAALVISYPDEKDVSGEVKFKRADLARRLRTNSDYTPTSEEVTMMKNLTGKLYGPSLVYTIFPLIDPGHAKK